MTQGKHEQLKLLEGQKLEKEGYIVRYEFEVMPHCVVDIFAIKGNETIIIECGFCNRSKERMWELLKYATKVIHVPYPYGSSFRHPWFAEDPSQRAHEEMQKIPS